MRTFSAIVVAALLAGCATKPPPTKIISVPTPVPCVKPEQVPAEPERIAEQLTGDMRHDFPIVAASALDLRSWGEKLQALLTACQ